MKASPSESEEIQTATETSSRKSMWRPLYGYLLSCVFLAGAILLGNREIENSRLTGDDMTMFVGIFYYLGGTLIFLASTLMIFVAGRNKEKKDK